MALELGPPRCDAERAQEGPNEGTRRVTGVAGALACAERQDFCFSLPAQGVHASERGGRKRNPTEVRAPILPRTGRAELSRTVDTTAAVAKKTWDELGVPHMGLIVPMPQVYDWLEGSGFAALVPADEGRKITAAETVYR